MQLQVLMWSLNVDGVLNRTQVAYNYGSNKKMYLYNQDAVIKVCFKKYGGLAGYNKHVDALNEKYDNRLERQKLLKISLQEKYTNIIQEIYQSSSQNTISFTEYQDKCEQYKSDFLTKKLSQKALKNIAQRQL